jgi:molybdopterin-containing oxidoreductase family membrane subunit
VPLSDVKTQTAVKEISPDQIEYHSKSLTTFDRDLWTITASFDNAGIFTNEVNRLLNNKNSVITTYSPQRIEPLMQTLGLTRSPVRWWTFCFGLLGAVSGYSLAIYCALVNHLIVGGKHPVSIIPYTIIAFEFTILFGSIANFIAFIFYTHLSNRKKPVGYNPRFALDRFGLVTQCSKEEINLFCDQFASHGAVQTEILSPEVQTS